MRRKVLSLVLVAGLVSVVAILSIRRAPKVWRVEEILAVYEEDANLATIREQFLHDR